MRWKLVRIKRKINSTRPECVRCPHCYVQNSLSVFGDKTCVKCGKSLGEAATSIKSSE